MGECSEKKEIRSPVKKVAPRKFEGIPTKQENAKETGSRQREKGEEGDLVKEM